jgi:hypothetical protein
MDSCRRGFSGHCLCVRWLSSSYRFRKESPLVEAMKHQEESPVCIAFIYGQNKLVFLRQYLKSTVVKTAVSILSPSLWFPRSGNSNRGLNVVSLDTIESRTMHTSPSCAISCYDLLLPHITHNRGGATNPPFSEIPA